MAKNEFEDAPFGVFKTGYSWITWLSTVGLVLLTVWTLWIMFMNTPAGTRRSQQLAAVKPTLEVIPEQYLARADACRPPKPDSGVVGACLGCHVFPGFDGSSVVGPSLSDIRTVALERIADPAYTGSATTAEEYIAESVLEPSAYVVESPPGKAYGSPGASIMPARGGLPDSAEFEQSLQDIVTWLMYDPEVPCEEEEVASR